MANQTIRIRTACREDLKALVSFNQAMAIETEARELPNTVITAGVKALLENKSLGEYFIAAEVSSRERETGILGALMLTYEWSDWRNGLFWWIQSVYVVPQQRRRGVYSRLHEHVKNLSRQDEKCCGIRLYVEKENAAAQLTYAHLGMEKTHYYIYEEEYQKPA